MTKRYSIAEARASLPTIVNDVEAGAEIELTRRGKPVAILMSRSQYEQLVSDRPRFADAYRAFCQLYDPKEVGIDADIFEELRERSSGRDVDI